MVITSTRYPEEIEQIRRRLSGDMLKVFDYFLRNISVGEIIAVRELQYRYKIDKPLEIIVRLINEGLLEKGEGCYNLSKGLRELLWSKGFKVRY